MSEFNSNRSCVNGFKMKGDVVCSYCENSSQLYLPENAKRLSGNIYQSSMINDVNIRDNLVEVVFPEGFEAIEDIQGKMLVGRCGALSDCVKLREVVFPSSINYIGALAFDRCRALSTVSFPAEVHHLAIGEYAFSQCDSLKEITIPEGTERIEQGAFFLSGLESISLPSTLKSIEESGFFKSKIRSVQLPGSLEMIGKNAFSTCNLESIIIPKSVRDIGETAFMGCEALKTVVFQSEDLIYASRVFYGCKNLREIMLIGLKPEHRSGIDYWLSEITGYEKGSEKLNRINVIEPDLDAIPDIIESIMQKDRDLSTIEDNAPRGSINEPASLQFDKEDRESLLKYLHLQIDCEKQIRAALLLMSATDDVLEYLNKLKNSNYKSVLRNVMSSGSPERTRAILSDIQNLKNQRNSLLKRKESSARESIFTTADMDSRSGRPSKPEPPKRSNLSKPQEPDYKQPYFFNRKKVEEENLELKKQYERQMHEYEEERTKYNRLLRDYERRLAEYNNDVQRYKKRVQELKTAAQGEAAREIDKELETQSKRIKEAEARLEKVKTAEADAAVNSVEALIDYYSVLYTNLKAEYEQGLDQAVKANQLLYSSDVIFPKYRNLSALTTLCEYIESERCEGLTGPHGAYNLLEQEIRDGLIISKLDDIIDSLDQIIANQYMLYQAIKGTNHMLGQINERIARSTRTISKEIQKAADQTVASIESGTAIIMDQLKDNKVVLEEINNACKVSNELTQDSNRLLSSVGLMIALTS